MTADAPLKMTFREWELKAAKGECAWTCASCCMGFPEGMPEKCAYGNQSCTDLINRDKREALAVKS